MIRRFSFPRPLLFFLPVFLVLLVASCTPSHPQSTFGTAGPVADQQRTLFLIIFWLAVAVFVVVEGALIYAVIRFRRRPGQGTPAQVHGNRRLEIAWTIAPAIVLIGVAIPSITVILDTQNTPKECEVESRTDECLAVNVTAHQWWWEFEYPDYGLVTANELHIPAGKFIDLGLDSADVLHSFWVPKLGGKTDVVPREGNRMWLRADEAGTFQGRCAEFCSISHAKMKFIVIAHPTAENSGEPCEFEPCPEEDFDTWVKSQQQEAVTPDPTNVAVSRGKQVFEAKQCWVCHTIRGVPLAAGTIGPDLTHFGSRTTLAAAVLEKPPEDEGVARENVARWLRDPAKVKPGNIMARDALVYRDPALALSEADIQELTTYLLSLQ